jgi:hypothetical protein
MTLTLTPTHSVLGTCVGGNLAPIGARFQRLGGRWWRWLLAAKNEVVDSRSALKKKFPEIRTFLANVPAVAVEAPIRR